MHASPIQPVSDSLSITIEGPQLREASDRLETTGGFVVAVENVGRATHVHFALEGDLAEETAITEPNRFVDSGERLEVPIRIDAAARPLDGAVIVATGYGAEEVRIPIVIEDDPTTPTPTPAPERHEQPGGRLERLRSAVPAALSNDTLAFAAVAIGAIALAALAVLVTNSPVVLVGALLVIGAVSAGSCYLLLV